ncbi:hypothetical protein P8452_64777 [Trifolium repens]|jgi:hypothetical protein|nr:hypothetical protein QL285_095227 [Trifolium repens]WJX60099.1 hypothetical protein P8452_45337 [Trifolium repens]WJX81958.1 hypothetical protein P8452_64777 [Trifolium repens]
MPLNIDLNDDPPEISLFAIDLNMFQSYEDVADMNAYEEKAFVDMNLYPPYEEEAVNGMNVYEEDVDMDMYPLYEEAVNDNNR